MKHITICIPTYEMNGLGGQFLRESFEIMTRQTFTDFDVVISDHSHDDVIMNLCNEYGNKLEIHYYRNTEHIGNSSANINHAIRKATGRLIKILFQDDFLYSETSLAEIAKHFDLEKDHWMVTASIHTKDGSHFFKPFHPKYHRSIHLGDNTISSPSVLTIKNDDPLFFDENLLWLMDVEYYKRCFDRFGAPNIISTIGIVNRVGTHQVSNTLSTLQLRDREFKKVLKKYEHGPAFWYYRIRHYCKHLIKRILS